MSSSLKSGSRFALEDIDSRVSKRKMVKIEAEKSSEPKTSASTAHPKPPPAKKKKSSNSSDASVFSGMDFMEINNKLQDLHQLGREQMIRLYNEAMGELHEAESTIANMKKLVAVRAKTTAEEMDAMKKALKDAESKHARELDTVMKDMESKHAQELESLLEGAKDSAALTIYEARLKMAKEANDPNFDKSSWDVADCELVVAELREKLCDEGSKSPSKKAGSSGAAIKDPEGGEAEVNMAEGKPERVVTHGEDGGDNA